MEEAVVRGTAANREHHFLRLPLHACLRQPADDARQCKDVGDSGLEYTGRSHCTFSCMGGQGRSICCLSPDNQELRGIYVCVLSPNTSTSHGLIASVPASKQGERQTVEEESGLYKAPQSHQVEQYITEKQILESRADPLASQACHSFGLLQGRKGARPMQKPVPV